MVSGLVAFGVVFVAIGATAIVFRDRIADIVFSGLFPTPGTEPPEPPPTDLLCVPEFEFEKICLAVSQMAQDDFNRFMQYRVDYQNITNEFISFDLIGQFKDENGQVVDLQPRRQSLGPGERKQFTFNFIWITPGVKQVDIFAWVSVTNPTPLSKVSSVNTVVS